MDIKNILTTAAAALVGALVVVALVPAKSTETVREQFGALSGPDVYSYLFVHGVFSQGGGITTATPDDATYTITASDLRNSNVLTFVASTTMPALTATLPASTTFPLPSEKGAMRTWIIENPFTAAATTTTIAAGTGVDLQEPDGQNVVIGINNYALVSCIRGADSGSPEDIVCTVDEHIPAD